MCAFLNVASSCGPLSTERCPFSCLIGAVLKVLRCIVFRTGSSFGCCGVDRCMCVSMCAWGPLPRAMQSKKLKKRTGKYLENATGQPKQMRYWSRGCARDSIVVKQAVQASPNRMHQRIRGKRSHADLNRDRWIQSPECWPLHHRTADASSTRSAKYLSSSAPATATRTSGGLGAQATCTCFAMGLRGGETMPCISRIRACRA